MITLNPEQQMAVGHLGGPCVVTAVPGSGKTRTLTSRVVHLIKQQSIEPGQILCLTFTNKAANEMRERVAGQLGEPISDRVWISTFHKLCLAILRKHGHIVGLSPGFSVYDESGQRELLAKVSRMHDVPISPGDLSWMLKVVNDFREETEDFASCLDLVKPAHLPVLKEYLELLDDFNAVDFSGILYKTWTLLNKDSTVVKSLSSRFKYVLVDEGQDTNTIQYEVVKKIAEHENLFVVGDYQQSIFGWRGAKPENLWLVKRDFKDVREITLPRNYRSTSQILKVAECLIRHNPNTKQVTLYSERGDGDDININQYKFPDDEAQGVIGHVARLRRRGNYEWNDFAILYRTNHQSRILEMMLRKHHIPYRIYGGFSFFDRREIKTTLAYLSLLANPHDTVAFARAISIPKRQIGDTFVGRLERICQTEKVSILEACDRVDDIKGTTKVGRTNLKSFVEKVRHYQDLQQEGVSVSEIAGGFLADAGYYPYIKEAAEKDEDWRKRSENVDELLLGIADFEQQKPSATIADYLQMIQLSRIEDEDDGVDAITLLTIHSAKGLEFPVVFVIGIEKNILPHKMALRDNRVEEERRLLYVAITRAKDHLFLSHCDFRRQFNFVKKANIIEKTEPSMFLAEVGYR